MATNALSAAEKATATSGGNSHDPIVLDEKKDHPANAKQDPSVNNNSPKCPPAKRPRTEENIDTANKRKEDNASRPCPIKLFATFQDEDMRRSHREDTGDHNHWSYIHCWTLRELLGFDRHPEDNIGEQDSVDWIVISNFMVDFYFILNEMPELLSIPNVIVIYHHAEVPEMMEQWKELNLQSQVVDFVQRNPSARPQGRSNDDYIINPLYVTVPYGCHHTKLFLVGYNSGRLRVVVHTSNLRYNDVHLKCQGAFVQDFWLKNDDELNMVTSEFEETLIEYLLTYRYLEKRTWQQPRTMGEEDTTAHNDDLESCLLVDQISKYDFSNALGKLIPSIPGFHRPKNNKEVPLLGYLAVKKAIQKHTTVSSRVVAGGSIVCQFSSIGSLSEKYLQLLWEAWDVNNKSGKQPNNKQQSLSRGNSSRFQLELVYPTYQEVVESVEGLAGGGSVPGSSRNVDKPFLKPLYRKWKKSHPESDDDDDEASTQGDNCTFGKGQNIPHIKTYYQSVANDDSNGMHWFVLGSQNLSKAAWGEHQNGSRGPSFKIFHWELGVFVSPQILGVDRLSPFIKDRTLPSSTTFGGSYCEIPLPYPFRPEEHQVGDTAWTIDRIPHGSG